MEQKELSLVVGKFITKKIGGCVVFSNNTLGKWVDNEFIIKPSVYLSNFKTIWEEDFNPNTDILYGK